MTIASRSKKANTLPFDSNGFSSALLGWYDLNARDLPWRAKSGQKADIYHVWLSEIMLQQTTVGAVISYFLKFIKKWPRLQDLAAAPEDEILAAWAGLGYYSRARNLIRCAKIVSENHEGVFPSDLSALKELPGIGDYTAAAILAIGFSLPAIVVDGNVERIAARIFNVHTPLPEAKKALNVKAEEFYAHHFGRPGDLAQALMDLGATVCIPKSPRCGICPVKCHCQAFAKGQAAILPLRLKKAKVPERLGTAFWVRNKKGEVLIIKRPEKGLLGGMWALPSTDWVGKSAYGSIQPPGFIRPKPEPSKKPYISHIFTHFSLKLFVQEAEFVLHAPIDHRFMWVDETALLKVGFPTVFKKAANVFMTVS